MLAALEKLPAPVGNYLEEGKALEEELLEMLGDQGVMLFPSYSCVAPKHDWPKLQFCHWVHTAVFNALGSPSTQTPLGLNHQGIPLGVQVVGAPGRDHVTMAVAMEMERLFGGWSPPREAGETLKTKA
jgi:fatty acid amide hydrolase 2